MGTKASTARTCKQELVDNLSTHWIWKLCCSIFGLASFYRDYEILKKAPAPSEDHEALQIVFRKFLVHAKTSSCEAPGKAG